jgi:hypothetical protein
MEEAEEKEEEEGEEEEEDDDDDDNDDSKTCLSRQEILQLSKPDPNIIEGCMHMVPSFTYILKLEVKVMTLFP